MTTKTNTKTKATETVTDKTTDGAAVNTVLKDHDLLDLMDKYKTKSAVIRFLAAEGHTRSMIASALGIRYQHVRNVLVQEEQKQAALGDQAKKA